MPDLQTILVSLFILAAAAYVARRALMHLKAFRIGKRSSQSCDEGCGCSGGNKQGVEIKRTIPVKASRAGSSHKHHAR